MCGILGALQSNPDATLRDRALKALTVLQHRGPDGQGLWMDARGQALLGHRRLHVTGSAQSSQPLCNETGDVWISVSGEFYDHKAIRKDLQTRGHRFSSDTDSEILVHLYEDHGVDCLEFLRGEFAFIVWDERRQTLFAARDRFGIKPLVYAKNPQGLFLASEAKALFALGICPQWDQDAFYSAACMQYVPPDRTLFKNVFQLRPGHYLLAREDSFQDRCYWDMNFPELGAETGAAWDEKATVSAVAEQLREAVRLRLDTPAPYCFHLSGGLDSAALLSVACEHNPKNVHAFTACFEHSDYDERLLARDTAQHLKVNWHPVIIHQQDLLQQLEAAVYYSEGLAINGHLPAKFILNQAIRQQGFKVVLGGEGADELLAGYPHFRVDTFEGDPEPGTFAALESQHHISQGIMLPTGPALSTQVLQETLGYTPCFLQAKAGMGYKCTTLLADDFKQRFEKVDCFADLLGRVNGTGQLKDKHRLHQSAYLWCKTALPNYILRTLGDGVEMAHSLEGRLPFLDHKLFERLKHIPIGLQIKAQTEKHVLREAFKTQLTAQVYQRPKHPLMAPPLLVTLNGPYHDFVLDTLRSQAVAGLPFFNTSKVQKWMENLEHKDRPVKQAWDPVIMTVLSAALLGKRYGLSH